MSCMDGTILRRLRELKADGELNYRIKNSELSIYEKFGNAENPHICPECGCQCTYGAVVNNEANTD